MDDDHQKEKKQNTWPKYNMFTAFHDMIHLVNVLKVFLVSSSTTFIYRYSLSYITQSGNDGWNTDLRGDL